MDFLLSIAIFKVKTVIFLNNIIMGALYALNLFLHRLLITFVRLPESIQKLNNWRNKSAIFAVAGASFLLSWVRFRVINYIFITLQVYNKNVDFILYDVLN